MIQIKTIKSDDSIMKLLEVSTINRVICNTNKGVLTLQIRQGDKQYHLVLDAVPLLPDLNKELMAILFPVPIPQTAPQVNKTTVGQFIDNSKRVYKDEIVHKEPLKTDQALRDELAVSVLTKKKGGRPKGSINKPK